MIMKKLLILLFLTFLILTSCKSTKEEPVENVYYFNFHSTDGRTVKVDYEYKSVKIVLWDGKEEVLAQVVSGSGARYKNSKYILWNKGDKITVWEGKKIVFEGLTD